MRPQSSWDREETVAGFAQASANETLLRFAGAELRRAPQGQLLDIGCGAGRNLVPLARLGWRVVGVDLSWPMLVAAHRRARADGGRPFPLARAGMEHLPLASGAFDLIVAHGIWNLAASGAQMRAAIAEAARAAAPEAALFVFTFSRHTLPAEAAPVPGERFVFTELSGAPQCFLTADELVAELAAAGFRPDPSLPLRELNRGAAAGLRRGGPPVIWEGAFRRTGEAAPGPMPPARLS